jgi:chemotaxis protein CheD
MNQPFTIDIFLQPGEFHVGDADCRIRTLLGSCVSITLWHPAKKIGAMSHFLLPSRQKAAPGDLDGRYGDEAMELMLRELLIAGADPAECEAKIFGGGDMFPDKMGIGRINVGARNGNAARGLLTRRGLNIVSESLFGNGHRNIIFNVANGDVWVRHVEPARVPMPAPATQPRIAA